MSRTRIVRSCRLLAAILTAAACGGGGDGGTDPPPTPTPTPTLALAVAPAAGSVVQGQSTTTTATITRGGGFAGPVTLAVTGAPTGVTATLSPSTIAAGATTGTITLASSATTAPGNYALVVTATGTGVAAQSAPFALTVTAAPVEPTPAFTLALVPPTLSVAPGSSGSVQASVTRTGGFAGEVALAFAGAPQGVSVTATPSPVVGDQATIAVAVAAATAPGDYSITVTATGPAVAEQTATLALTVPAGPTTGSYSLAFAPASVGMQQGATGRASVSITRTGGFAGAVTIGVSSAPTGLTATLDRTSLVAGFLSSELTLQAAPTLAPGDYSVSVVGTTPGLPDVTVTLPVTVTAAPTAGFTLALAPTTVSLAQGSSANATVTVARTGSFAGDVALEVAGAPPGVTATLTPTSVAGGATQATLSLQAAPTAAVGGFTLTVRGNAPGLPEQTATLSAQVTQPPTGGALEWNFCASAAPIWLAYQDADGPWTQLPVSSGTRVAIPIGTRGGVAFVRRLGAFAGADIFRLEVYYATTDELRVIGDDWCGTYGGGKQVSGSIAGLAPTDQSFVVLGIAGAFASGAQPSYALTTLPDGVHDLIASRQLTTGTGAATVSRADKFIFRRDQDPPNGSTLPVLDFGGAEAFDPVTRTVTIGGLGAEAAQVSLAYLTANRTNGLLFGSAMPSPATQQEFFGAPSSQQRAGDLHQLIVTATSDATPNVNRSSMLFFREATDRSVALGPALATPTVSAVASAPYGRPRMTLPRQSEYDDQVVVQFLQSTRSAVISATAGYFGGAPSTWDLTLPDLTGAGFDPSWGPGAGAGPTTWFANAFGWDGGGPGLLVPSDGLSIRSAGFGGSMALPTVMRRR